MTIGFSEGQRLLPLMGAQPETAFGPAGLGDLYVTSASPRSRNRTLGEKLGSGKSLEEGLAEMHMVARGSGGPQCLLKERTLVGCDVPFINSLCAFLDGEITAPECVRSMAESVL
ncbi:MAG: hypothetical protein Ct9H90mP16_00020 [Candidatus Poseidoniales archaeon]|nr:MAG: hypothetical protein Ct9H90mP16_00020 [Candidatus Poseidoniales archaeon]